MSFKDAEKFRNWLSNISSTLLKICKDFPIDKKVKNIWKQKPEHWPNDALFYDPHNTKNKGRQDNQRLLTMLLKCVEMKGVQISVNIKEEIEAWKNHDKKILLKLFTLRQNVKQIESELSMLAHYSTSNTQTFHTKRFSLALTFLYQTDPKTKKVIHRSEAMRIVACLLCKIYHGVQVEIKADSIWKTRPKNWPDNISFTNPYYKRDKCDKWEDERLAKTLLNCCVTEAIDIPAQYRKITTALSENDYENLTTNVVVCSSEAKLQKAFIQLDNDNILEETCEIVRQRCSEIVHSLKVEQNCLTPQELLTCTSTNTIHQYSNHKHKVTDVNIKIPKKHLHSKGKKLKLSDIDEYNERVFVAKEDQMDALSSSFINSTSSEIYPDICVKNVLPVNCNRKTRKETDNYTFRFPLHHVSEEQVQFKHGCLTDYTESGCVDQEDQINILSPPSIYSTSGEQCFNSSPENVSNLHCNGDPETETAVSIRNLLDSVDLSKQVYIDKNFSQSLCHHLHGYSK